MQVLLEEYMLSYFGCVLPALRSHDKQTVEEGENEAEILHRDITLVRKISTVITGKFGKYYNYGE